MLVLVYCTIDLVPRQGKGEDTSWRKVRGTSITVLLTKYIKDGLLHLHTVATYAILSKAEANSEDAELRK